MTLYNLGRVGSAEVTDKSLRVKLNILEEEFMEKCGPFLGVLSPNAMVVLVEAFGGKDVQIRKDYVEQLESFFSDLGAIADPDKFRVATGEIKPTIDEKKKRKTEYEAGEQARVERLKKLVRVSEALEIPQMAKILGLSEDDLYNRIVDWADEFGFTLDRQVVKFAGGKKEAFISQMEKEFASWGKDGKKE